MASYNSAPSAPQISSQPASTSVTTGQTFFLSVTVAGGDMSYQWYQNGAAISGATASTYSKASTSTDAGSYTVTAMNPAGSVTSNAATVNVTTPAPTPSGGGGGGGGAPSSYYMIILVVLAGLRRFVRGTAP